VSRSVSRFLVIAAVTIPLGANLTLPTIASAANGPGISPSADPTVPVNGSATDLRMRRQAILTQLAVPLRDEFETRDSEYSGLAIDPDAGEVTVYFHNKPGPASQERLNRVATAGSVSIVVKQAKYSKIQLEKGQVRIWQLADRNEFHGVGVYEDGHGLFVRTKSPSPSLDAKLSALAGVSVTSELAGAEISLTRQADYAPFWGGARLINAGGGGCTSGFGVYHAVTGTRYIVTAAHCGSGFTTPTGNVVGNTAWNGFGYKIDAQLVSTGVGGRIYDGVWNDSSGYNKPVSGYAQTVVGQWVCTSGSYSGAVCGIRVSNRGYTHTSDGHVVVSDEAEQVNHSDAAGNGDSGGPVFSVTPADNYTHDTVVGTIVSGSTDTQVSCQGVPADAGRKCFWRIQFARFNNLKIDANVLPVIG
jgi:hypothetical protein